ncbi:hypothetical protein [Mesorhizobium sp.]|uniref:hypothetical protein n=1 Tax=Mesorhizobium sp. TaxID=1871066 RepID=UPI0025D9741C|nr:hypothetical protein [Mesorhizobium sp.]
MSNDDPFTLDLFNNTALSSGLGFGVIVMATQDNDHASRELIRSEDYRRKPRGLLRLDDKQTMPPRLVASAVELQEELERRGIELADENPQLH